MSAQPAPRISWARIRDIFGNPAPPAAVTERQFDGFDDDLRRMARTPWEQFDFSDLWYYHHDLAYVELQPDLFDYLFPVCLMDWQDTLLRNQGCSHGDSEFHYGVLQGDVLRKMLTPDRRAQVYEFFRDGMLDRMDRERGFPCRGSAASAHGWISRLNSLGFLLPDLAPLWDAWWDLSTPGAAVAWLEYASGLMYAEGSNPLFGTWTREAGGGGPYLWENDSHLFRRGWPPRNLAALRERLTPSAVTALVHRAAAVLRGEPEEDRAAQLVGDLAPNQERVECRCRQLPDLLGASEFVGGWP